jgi:glycosyltransferase involved in cell wall biosynthesis
MLQLGKVKTRVLIVSRLVPDPTNGSAIHTEDLIRYLRQSRCEVHYLALSPVDPDCLARSSADTVYFPERTGYVPTEFDAAAGEWEGRAMEKACRQAMPSVVIADYSWMGALFDGAYFKENPSVKRIVFVHDLRVRILPSLVKMGLIRPEQNRWTPDREGRLLAKAEVLLTLNDEDRQAAQAMAPQARILKIGLSASPHYVDPAAVVPGRCIYVASAAPENLFAAMWLLKYVWPRVLAAHPAASLSICGTVCDLLKQVIGSDNAWLGSVGNLNVVLEGRRDDLDACYAAAPIALVPHWMMGGLKIKHVEAIARGLAVVCTPAGADGLPQAVGYSALAAEMPAEFADHLINLMKDPDLLARTRENSRNLGLKMTPAAAYQEVGDYLREAQ